MLLSLRDELTSGGAGDVVARARAASARAEAPGFVFSYAAVLAAREGRLDLAIELLGNVSDHPFAGALRRFLREHGRFEKLDGAFSSAVPYDVWSRTRFYRSYSVATLDALAQCILATPRPESAGRRSVIDIGPGNGVLLCSLLNRLVEHEPDLAGFHVVLVEPSSAMVELCSRRIEQGVARPVEITVLPSRVEDADLLGVFAGRERPWFINAAASLHHMPRDRKLVALEALLRVGGSLFISDFEADHDLPEADEPRFVCSIFEFYGHIIDDVMHCDEPPGDKLACVDRLLLAEAITMLASPRSARGDYHAPLEDWVGLARKAGWVDREPVVTTWAGRQPLTFTLALDGTERACP